MDWVVTCKMNGLEATYDPIVADRYYDARVKGINQFLIENRIPGRPWEYISKKRGVIEVTVRTKEDSRKDPRRTYELDYFLEQAGKLKDQIRDSTLSTTVKRESVKLLRNLREVLDGSAVR